MVDQEIFSKRLDALDGYLSRLRALRAVGRDEFTSVPSIHDLAERYLHLMMECVLDLANHAIATRSLRTPGSYRDAFVVLAEAGELDLALAGRLGSWAGYRNVLVHEYLEIDHQVAWDAIQDDLADIDAFAAWARAALSGP